MRNKIDIDKWPRKQAYETFSNYSNPYTGIVVKIDITNLVHFCKQNNVSLLVNHAFQGGYHIGMFFNKLQQNIDNLKIEKII